MRRRRWFPLSLAMLATFTLAACAGAPPQVEGVELDATSQGETAMEFVGSVDSMGTNAWSIGGLVVALTASTEVTGNPGVGDLVRVHALVLEPATLVAREIELVEGSLGAPSTPSATAAAGEEIEFSGPVAAITSDAWLVGDRTVGITSETEIKGSISIGQVVKVHALVQPDLTLTAREIEPDPEAGSTTDDDDGGEDEDLEIKGAVESIIGETWTVAGMTIRVPVGTPIEGDIQVGDFVEIHAVWSSDGVLTAVRIQREDESGEIDDSNDDSDDDSDDESGDEGHDDEEDESGSDDDDDSGSGDG